MIWTHGTRDIVTESQVIAKIYRVIHSGFVSQKLLQIAVNGLCILNIRSAQNVPKWWMNVTDISMVISLCINCALHVRFGSRNMHL